MPAIARSSEFGLFVRKIGFSVGLEYTLDRMRDFAILYASKEILSYGDINRLLHLPKPAGWGLELTNEHVLEVFRSLEILSVSKGEVNVLEVGEALGILRKLQNDETFEKSLRFLFAHALVRADGDIFLNALAACFDPVDFRARATRMLEFKWSILEGVFSAPSTRTAIYQAVNIEAQTNNPGSRGHGIGGRSAIENQSALTRKTGPLRQHADRPEPFISDAYLRKALPRRKSWARSLDLIDEFDNQTELGRRFLNVLGAGGLGAPGCLIVWPLTSDLTSPAFSKMALSGQKIMSSWDFLILIGQAMSYLGQEQAIAKANQSSAIDLLIEFLTAFRSLNHSKRILRRELPGRVAYRCALAWNIGKKQFSPYPAIIANEQLKATPRIVARPSRYAELALS
jgi:hypothetical protein